MIILDTHAWIWWVSSPELLPTNQRKFLESSSDIIAVSIISLWEVYMLERKGRIKLPYEIEKWFENAIEESGINIIDLSRKIIIESNHLPGAFHRDPADRMIVATSRTYNAPLVTADKKILEYAHVLIAGK